MAAAARMSDAIAPHACWSGGMITAGDPTVMIGGLPASTIDSPGTPHLWICPKTEPPHPVKVSMGSGTVMIGGKAAARLGDTTDCGSLIISGLPTVNIGG